MHNDQPIINSVLVQRLISTQFPKWANLPIRPVVMSGWDNRTFHLGDQMLVRMPSAACYALQVEKEQYWLPKLAPLLPISIPTPLAVGKPDADYPWKWSVFTWLAGNTAASAPIADLNNFAARLAQFLLALQRIESREGPLPGTHNFYRGGKLIIYDAEIRVSIAALNDKLDVTSATAVWEAGLASTWNEPQVWFHGDVSAGNLLVREGKLTGVIDFGQMGVGDPACGLTVAWTLFKNESREIFKSILSLDNATWARARAWALWKAVITAAGFINHHNVESAKCWQVIDRLLADHRGYF